MLRKELSENLLGCLSVIGVTLCNGHSAVELLGQDNQCEVMGKRHRAERESVRRAIDELRCEAERAADHERHTARPRILPIDHPLRKLRRSGRCAATIKRDDWPIRGALRGNTLHFTSHDVIIAGVLCELLRSNRYDLDWPHGAKALYILTNEHTLHVARWFANSNDAKIHSARFDSRMIHIHRQEEIEVEVQNTELK